MKLFYINGLKNITGLCLIAGLAAGVACSKKADPAQSTATNPQSVTSDSAPGDIPSNADLQGLSPMDSIKALDKKVDHYKTGTLTAEEDVKNRKLKQEIISGTFDLAELCKLSLDTHWNEINDEQKNHFVSLMTKLLERKAIFSKEQVKTDGKPYDVVYKSEKYLDAEKTRASVASKILVPTQKVDLNISYSLLNKGGIWKIYDVIVDDASLVDNYKFQFDTIIKKSGFADLIARMEKKLAEMK